MPPVDERAANRQESTEVSAGCTEHAPSRFGHIERDPLDARIDIIEIFTGGRERDQRYRTATRGKRIGKVNRDPFGAASAQRMDQDREFQAGTPSRVFDCTCER